MKRAFIFIGALLFGFTQVAEAAVAGRFQFVSGDVKVIAANGKERSASKGGEVNEGESVVTSPSSSAQIKMVDDGLIVVRPDTKLRITTFLYSGKTDGSERSFISLFKGGFRAITGAIGRVNKDNYKIETPTATIGIRGTDHEPTFIPNPAPGQVAIAEPGTYDKVNSGAAVLSTASGMVIIKPDQAGFVPNVANAAPRLLPTIPAFLRTMPSKDEPKVIPQTESGLKEGAKPVQTGTVKGTLTPLATGTTTAPIGTAKTLSGVGALSPVTTLKSGTAINPPLATTSPATISPAITSTKTLGTVINTPVLTSPPSKVLSPTVVPTVAPTVSPTITPVVAPTTINTVAPTITNVISPTVAPTAAPVVAPAPVPAPITAPVTVQPVTTIQPITTTLQPTIAPTVTPVVAPTPVIAPTTTIQPITTTIQPVTTTIQPISTFSDRRLKTNIKRIGTHRLGIGIYEFDYVWGEHAIGVMADEVKRVRPQAVTRHSSGYDMVDYGKLNQID